MDVDKIIFCYQKHAKTGSVSPRARGSESSLNSLMLVVLRNVISTVRPRARGSEMSKRIKKWMLNNLFKFFHAVFEYGLGFACVVDHSRVLHIKKCNTNRNFLWTLCLHKQNFVVVSPYELCFAWTLLSISECSILRNTIQIEISCGHSAYTNRILLWFLHMSFALHGLCWSFQNAPY